MIHLFYLVFKGSHGLNNMGAGTIYNHAAFWISQFFFCEQPVNGNNDSVEVRGSTCLTRIRD